MHFSVTRDPRFHWKKPCHTLGVADLKDSSPKGGENGASTLPSAGSIASSPSNKCSCPDVSSFEAASPSPGPSGSDSSTSPTLLGLAFLALGTDLGGGTAFGGITTTGLGFFMAGPWFWLICAICAWITLWRPVKRRWPIGIGTGCGRRNMCPIGSALAFGVAERVFGVACRIGGTFTSTTWPGRCWLSGSSSQLSGGEKDGIEVGLALFSDEGLDGIDGNGPEIPASGGIAAVASVGSAANFVASGGSCSTDSGSDSIKEIAGIGGCDCAIAGGVFGCGTGAFWAALTRCAGGRFGVSIVSSRGAKGTASALSSRLWTRLTAAARSSACWFFGAGASQSNWNTTCFCRWLSVYCRILSNLLL